jgi:NTP pyrophosphatase (non-canonical NTP hydrolase)
MGYPLDKYETLDSIAAEARRNSERWFPFVHDEDAAVVPLAVHYALGMCGEAGEVANLIKKALRKGETTSEGLADELADVFIYLLLLADEAGINLYAAYQHKRDICEKRWGKPAPVLPL